MARICLVGGSGFIGRNLAELLVRQLHVLIVPTRRRERAKRNLILLPTVDLIDADIYDEASLTRLFAYCDAVVNLVGVLHSKAGSPYGPGFRRAHVELPAKIVSACKRAGVPRLVHISALGAAKDAPSEYLRSKADGEAVILGSGLEATIFRPSVVFGPDDKFLNLFASLQKRLPVMLLGMPHAKFQPVYVEDVAQAIATSLNAANADESFGQIYTLAGPRVYTLEALVRYAGELSGHPRRIIGLGPRASMWLAGLMEIAPGDLMSRDNVRSMQVDNVSDAPFPFGIEPTSLEAVAATYLMGVYPRTRYDRYRDRAGRDASDEVLNG